MPGGPAKPYIYRWSDAFSEHIPSWTRHMSHLRGRPGLRYLEVGVFEGRSLIWMLENVLTDESARAVAVDLFLDRYFDGFLANLRQSGFEDKVELARGRSQAELRRLPLDSFDVVYIDGSHFAKNVLTDAVLSWGLLKAGGLIVFDDYDLRGPRSAKAAIDRFLLTFGDELDIVEKGRRQVMARKLPQAQGRVAHLQLIAGRPNVFAGPAGRALSRSLLEEAVAAAGPARLRTDAPGGGPVITFSSPEPVDVAVRVVRRLLTALGGGPAGVILPLHASSGDYESVSVPLAERLERELGVRVRFLGAEPLSRAGRAARPAGPRESGKPFVTVNMAIW